MSGDTQYTHPLWHIEEDATLAVANPPLELLVDFDAPSHFTLPPNCPVSIGLRPSWAVSAVSNRLGGSSRSGGRGAATAFGRVGGSTWSGEDPLVSEWREIGVPLLAKK